MASPVSPGVLSVQARPARRVQEASKRAAADCREAERESTDRKYTGHCSPFTTDYDVMLM